MGIYRKLRSCRTFRRKRLPFLQTLEDFDLVAEIGYGQETGRLITLKQLFLAGLGPTATVQRRLARLKAQGVVIPLRSDADRRVVQLSIDPEVHKAVRQYVALLRLKGA